jgi:putative membrane protein insertion efficiency factor
MMRALLMALVRGYRLLLSPWLGAACRFEPTCSAYALRALERYGAAAGSCLTVYRLAGCQPWCDGGHDPVPQALPRGLRLFSRLTPRADTPPADGPSSSPTKTS